MTDHRERDATIAPMTTPSLTPCPVDRPDSPDIERRFGALARLYGPGSTERLRTARIAVVGLGGVGSWCAEALARCGVGYLTLIDLDHIAESNLNRQIHALENTIGQAKVAAMAQRIAAINPACAVQTIDDFLTPQTAAQYLAPELDVIVDCTDQISAKVAMALLARARKQKLIVCGAAGWRGFAPYCASNITTPGPQWVKLAHAHPIWGCRHCGLNKPPSCHQRGKCGPKRIAPRPCRKVCHARATGRW